MMAEENEDDNASSIDTENLTSHANSLVCETCFSNTTLSKPDDLIVDEDSATMVAVTCANPECAYEGWIEIENGEIIELGGDIFHGDEHNGYREEQNVTYREHYKLNTEEKEEDAPVVDVDNPAAALTFTRDEIVDGWNPEVNYNCSCGFGFDTKQELAQHLLAVKNNKDQTQASQNST